MRRFLAERFFRIVGEAKTAAFVQEMAPEAVGRPEIFWGILQAWKETDPDAAEGFLAAMVQAGDAPPGWADVL